MVRLSILFSSDCPASTILILLNSSSGVILILLRLGGIINYICFIMEASKVLHYRNAVLEQYKTCIILTDKRAVIVTKLINDKMDDKSLIYISSNTYLICTMKMGVLNGCFVVRSPALIIYGCFVSNTVQGQIAVINYTESVARRWLIQGHKATCLDEIHLTKNMPDEKILRQLSCNLKVIPDVKSFLKTQFNNDLIISAQNKLNQYQVKLNCKSHCKCILKFDQQRLICYGVTLKGQFAGIAYMSDGSVQIQGQFQGNTPNGQALKRDLSSGRTSFGIYVHGDMRKLQNASEKGEQGQQSLIKLKEKIHSHALNFVNDFINQRPITLIKQFIQAIENTEEQYSQMKLRSINQQKGQIKLFQNNQMRWKIHDQNAINKQMRRY